VTYDNVLVTGGSGLLGRFVVDALRGRCHVRVLDIAAPRDDVEYRQVDVLDLPALAEAVAGFDAIVHLAGIDDGNDFPEQDYFTTNVQGTWNLLHTAESAGVRKLVVAGSSAAYGVGRHRAPHYLPIDEAHPQHPTATYGLTKQTIEIVCRSFAARGVMDVVCLRPTLIVRPEREAAILAQLAFDDAEADPPDGAQAVAGVAPYGALSLLRGYVRSADAARCFRLALEHDAQGFHAFNVAAADGIGHEPLLPRLERAFGRLPDIHDRQRFERCPCASVFDSRLARDVFGWEPRGDWNSVVAEHHSAQSAPDE